MVATLLTQLVFLVITRAVMLLFEYDTQTSSFDIVDWATGMASDL